MINRDFTRSNKEYIGKNKIMLIIIAALVVVASVVVAVFGFNGGTEVKGYNTFSINMGTEYKADKMSDYTAGINQALVNQKAHLASVQLTGEGDSATIVVKYTGKVKKVDELNEALVKDLKIDEIAISAIEWVKPSVVAKDYIYTVAGGLIILVIACIFIAFRYNLACAFTSLIGSLLSVLLFLSLIAIFRLTINSSFLAINIIAMILTLGESVLLFDALEKARNNMQDKSDRGAQLTAALKANAFRQKTMYIALFAISLIFVILMPSMIKQASLLFMYAIAVTMFMTIYALPFLWCLTITQVGDKIRVKKEVKAVPATEDMEGELENNYTENQVIEVKEDSGTETPSNDDNITIE